MEWGSGSSGEEVGEEVVASPARGQALTYERVVELEFGELAGIAAVLCIIVNIFAAQVCP